MLYRFFIRLVPDLNDDDYPSSKSDSSDQEDESMAKHASTTNALNAKNAALLANGATSAIIEQSNKSSDDDDEICDGLRTFAPTIDASQSITLTTLATVAPGATTIPSHAIHLERTSSLSFIPGQVERRRRKLPEIPKNKKCE